MLAIYQCQANSMDNLVHLHPATNETQPQHIDYTSSQSTYIHAANNIVCTCRLCHAHIQQLHGAALSSYRYSQKPFIDGKHLENNTYSKVSSMDGLMLPTRHNNTQQDRTKVDYDYE